MPNICSCPSYTFVLKPGTADSLVREVSNYVYMLPLPASVSCSFLVFIYIIILLLQLTLKLFSVVHVTALFLYTQAALLLVGC